MVQMAAVKHSQIWHHLPPCRNLSGKAFFFVKTRADRKGIAMRKMFKN